MGASVLSEVFLSLALLRVHPSASVSVLETASIRGKRKAKERQKKGKRKA